MQPGHNEGFSLLRAVGSLSRPAKKNAPAGYEWDLQIYEIFRAVVRAGRSRFDSSRRILWLMSLRRLDYTDFGRAKQCGFFAVAEYSPYDHG
jgi:hypothetical protein